MSVCGTAQRLTRSALEIDEQQKKFREGKKLSRAEYLKAKRKYLESWRKVGYGPI
jgi:hypothetical protein